jgi:hypothetical protein
MDKRTYSQSRRPQYSVRRKITPTTIEATFDATMSKPEKMSRAPKALDPTYPAGNIIAADPPLA